jgi:hypothetical protein
MNDADERNPGRELSRLRWGTSKLDRLISDVSARSSELTADQRRVLRELADDAEKENR